MNRLTLSCCLLVVAASAGAQQQSTEDAAAWYGIMFTPVGAFPEIEPASRASSQLSFRGNKWSIPVTNAPSQNSFGLTYYFRPKGGVRYDVTLGWLQRSNGSSLNEGTGVAGGAATGSFRQSAAADAPGNSIGLDWKFSFGLGHSPGNGGTEYWSVVGQVPLKWQYQLANKSALSAFASAGYGVAGVGDYADAEQGLRPMASFGAAS